MPPVIGQFLDETQSKSSGPLGVIQSRLDDPDPACGGRLLEFHEDVIVVNLDDQSQDVLVRGQVSMPDGIRGQLGGGDSGVIVSSVQR